MNNPNNKKFPSISVLMSCFNGTRWIDKAVTSVLNQSHAVQEFIFEYPLKNIIDFTLAMVELKKANVDFEINITLTRDQLNQSDGWDESLDQNTNFHGYIHDAKDMDKLFCDNTIFKD
jgi:hypothetical protein